MKAIVLSTTDVVLKAEPDISKPLKAYKTSYQRQRRLKHCGIPRFFHLNKIDIAIHSINYNFKFIKIVQAFSFYMDQVVVETPCCFVRGMLRHVSCCRHRGKFVLLQYTFLRFFKAASVL